MDDVRYQKEKKCEGCYLIKFCMMTASMRKLCEGPWKDEADRAKFIIEQILGIKKK